MPGYGPNFLQVLYWDLLCVGVCVFVLHPLFFPYRGDRKLALSSAYKTDRADFTDWMSCLRFMYKCINLANYIANLYLKFNLNTPRDL